MGALYERDYMIPALLINLEWSADEDALAWKCGPLFLTTDVENKHRFDVFMEECPDPEAIEFFKRFYCFNTNFLYVELADDDIDSDENQEIIDNAITEYEEETKLQLKGGYEIEVITDPDEAVSYIQELEKEVNQKIKNKEKEKRDNQFRFDFYRAKNPEQMSIAFENVCSMAKAVGIEEKDIHNISAAFVEEMFMRLRSEISQRVMHNSHFNEDLCITYSPNPNPFTRGRGRQEDILSTEIARELFYLIMNSGVQRK